MKFLLTDSKKKYNDIKAPMFIKNTQIYMKVVKNPYKIKKCQKSIKNIKKF